MDFWLGNMFSEKYPLSQVFWGEKRQLLTDAYCVHDWILPFPMCGNLSQHINIIFTQPSWLIRVTGGEIWSMKCVFGQVWVWISLFQPHLINPDAFSNAGSYEGGLRALSKVPVESYVQTWAYLVPTWAPESTIFRPKSSIQCSKFDPRQGCRKGLCWT